MKHIINNITLSALLLSGLMTATAQTYTKDVDVTVELQPELRAASRLDISPATLTRSYPASSLHYNSNAITMPVTPMISTLQPIAPASAYSPGNTDGYIVAGYYPWVKFGISAGYRLVNTRTTRLEAWGQFNRNRYKEPTLADEAGNTPRTRLATSDFDMGLDFSHSAGAGVLSATTSLYLSHFNYPLSALEPSTQNVARYRLGTAWHSTLDDTASGYAIEGNLDYFKFCKACFPAGFDLNDLGNPDGLHELSGSIGASGQLMFNDIFGMGLSLSYTGASINDNYRYMPGQNRFHSTGKSTRGVVSLGASFRFNAANFTGHIGPLVDIATGDNNGTNFGASGVLNWNISPYMLIFTTAESGTTLNTLGAMYDISRYAAPLSATGPSFLDGDIKLGLSIGPFKGFSMTAKGGYSTASHWVLPALTDGISTFAASRLSTAYYSLELKYANDRFTAKALLEGAVSDEISHGYYRWSDRAKQVLDISLTWRPIDELTIEGGYELRLGRKICCVTTLHEDTDLPLSVGYSFIPLGRISAGRIGASYAFDETISIFARIEGIGQRHYLMAGAVPGQRLNGLAGISLCF